MTNQTTPDTDALPDRHSVPVFIRRAVYSVYFEAQAILKTVDPIDPDPEVVNWVAGMEYAVSMIACSRPTAFAPDFSGLLHHVQSMHPAPSARLHGTLPR